MDCLLHQDQALLLSINGCHSPGFDFLMTLVSGKLIWLPGYILLAFALYRVQTRKEFLLTLVLILPVILLADQGASGLLKPLVGRLRPCHVPELQGLLHLPEGCGGKFGFASSHAANFFAIATYAGWHLRHVNRWVVIGLLAIASMVSYSRIYLGVHYPGDVLAGILIGIVSGGIGIGMFKLMFNWPLFQQNSNKTSASNP